MGSESNASLWTPDFMFDESPGPVDGAHHHHFFHGHPSPIFSPMPPPEYSAILESIEMGWAENGMDLWPEEQQLHGGGSGGDGEQNGAEAGGGKRGAVAAGAGGCKNLLTERNRRMRLNQQLLALRLLVPCISKMDKRSILIDAAEYLQGIHQKIEMLEKEMSEGNSTACMDSNLSPTSDGVPEDIPGPAIFHKIFEVDIEKINDRLFTVKVFFKRAKGVQAQIQRALESLGFDISNTMIHPTEQQKMLSTSFIHVKKQKHVTEESLKKRITEAALNCGIMVDNDD